jgi:hypothetical protein
VSLIPITRVRLALVSLVVCFVVGLGCKSVPTTGSSYMASVLFTNKTIAQIRVTTIEVFQTGGYRLKTMQTNELVLDKPGSTMENVLYGGLSSGTWTRVKVRVRDAGPKGYCLEANAFRVDNYDDRALESERKMLKSGFLQKLLDAVKARLP